MYYYRRIEHFQLRIGATFWGIPLAQNWYIEQKWSNLWSPKGPKPRTLRHKQKGEEKKLTLFVFVRRVRGKRPFLSFLEIPDPFWLAVLGHFLKQYGFPNGPQTLNPSNKTKVNGSIKLQCLPKIMKNVNRLFSLLFSIFSYAYAYFDLNTSGIFSRKTTSIPRP